MTSRDEVEVAWGFTLDSVDRLAGVATARAFGDTLSYGDRYDAAYGAIIETLLAAEARPDRLDLVRAGANAIRQATEAELHHHGVHRRYGPIARYRTYWQPAITTPVEDRVVERVATHQIWQRLHPRQQQAVLALAAANGDRAAAATLAGMSPDLFKFWLRRARVQFWRYWYEGQTPPSELWARNRGPSRNPTDLIRQRNAARRRAAGAQ